jgi:hypothetical protein
MSEKGHNWTWAARRTAHSVSPALRGKDRWLLSPHQSLLFAVAERRRADPALCISLLRTEWRGNDDSVEDG